MALHTEVGMRCSIHYLSRSGKIPGTGRGCGTRDVCASPGWSGPSVAQLEESLGRGGPGVFRVTAGRLAAH